MAIDFAAVDRAFPRYTEFSPEVPVWCLTPESTGYIHRFFDTSPTSPSGRYVGLTRLPTEDEVPPPGTAAEVVLIDLLTGTRRVVAETAGWESQLGAGVQWGATDRELLFNTVDPETWELGCVILDPTDGTSRTLPGSVYMAAPSRRKIVSASLDRTARAQGGYGVLLPEERMPAHSGAPGDDGVWVTDMDSGSRTLVASIADLVSSLLTEEHELRLGPGGYYGFHTKWNHDETRIMFVLRFIPDPVAASSNARPVLFLIAMDADGGGAKLLLPPFFWADRGGHHPNWMPDGVNALMNLRDENGTMRFVEIDGRGLGTVTPLSTTIVGGGHPSVDPLRRRLVTDAYLYEAVAYGDGTTPIRLVYLETETERRIIRIRTEPKINGERNILRVDPHPAWDREFDGIVFNGCPTGRRQVFLADLR